MECDGFLILGGWALFGTAPNDNAGTANLTKDSDSGRIVFGQELALGQRAEIPFDRASTCRLEIDPERPVLGEQEIAEVRIAMEGA